MNKLCVGWMTVAIVLGVVPSVSLAKNTHDGLTKILFTYVREGATNFTELCKDDHLTGYVEGLNATDPEAIKDTNDRFAFWLNVYNAYSLQAICQKYPIKSVNDLNPGGLIFSVVLKKSVWDKSLVMVNHKQYSLKQVDHEILRTTFKDPRIPFTIACGGIGCGPLRNEAYEGSTIDAQLEDQTRIFINDVRLNSFDVNTKTAVLSPLFKFSAKDFGKNQAELMLFIAKYLPVEIAQEIRKSASAWKVKYNSYDLTLNDTTKIPAEINERLVKEVMPKESIVIKKGEEMNKSLTKREITKYKGYESSSYTVDERHGAIEIRSYDSALLAEVEVSGERDEAINAGFRILAGYIFGNNFSKEKIAMTTPVNQAKSAQGWMVRFMMPSKYSLETLPKPRDQRIQFKVTKPVKKVVIRFSGFISEGNINQHVLKLKAYISEYSLEVQGEPQYMFYDAPWTLPFLRRNEIAFILDKESES